MIRAARFAPVAQVDRVLVSETKGQRFESSRARQISFSYRLTPSQKYKNNQWLD